MPNTAVSEYELMLLFKPSFSETEVKQHIEAIKTDFLAPLGGKVTFEDFWGKKRLAYPIRKEDSAWYVLMQFTGNGAKLAGLDEELRIDARVLRHLLLKVGKDHQAKTLAEINDWNAKNLPKEEKRKTEEKRAPFRSNRPVVAAVVPATDILADIEDPVDEKTVDDLL